MGAHGAAPASVTKGVTTGCTGVPFHPRSPRRASSVDVIMDALAILHRWILAEKPT